VVATSQGTSGGRLTLWLTCALDYRLDAETGQRSAASGDELLTVSYASGGRAVLKLQNLGAELIGSVTDERIVGATEYFLRGVHVRQEIVIERATGAYRRTLEVADGAPVIHVGTCRQ
jgi:hypothetical protein